MTQDDDRQGTEYWRGYVAGADSVLSLWARRLRPQMTPHADTLADTSRTLCRTYLGQSATAVGRFRRPSRREVTP